MLIIATRLTIVCQLQRVLSLEEQICVPMFTHPVGYDKVPDEISHSDDSHQSSTRQDTVSLCRFPFLSKVS
jgi:hypothetical protein